MSEQSCITVDFSSEQHMAAEHTAALRNQLMVGNFEHAPPDIDRISSARLAGQVLTPQVLADARFSLYEAVSETTGGFVEFFPKVTLQWDGTDFSDGQKTITQIAAAGLSPQGSRLEADMREAEYVEAAMLKKLPDTKEQQFVTISKPLIAGEDQHIMIRLTKFEQSQETEPTVTIEQVALPATDYFAQQVNVALERINDGLSELEPPELLLNFFKTGADCSRVSDWLVDHGILSSNDSELAARNSRRRQEFVDQYAGKLGSYALQLAASETVTEEANMMYERQIRNVLLQAARSDPSLAHDVFGEQVGELYSQALQAELIGELSMAERLWRQAATVAPEVTMCRVGTCGISQASVSEVQHAKELGMESSTILRVESACMFCGHHEKYVDAEDDSRGPVCANDRCSSNKRSYFSLAA